MVCYFLSIQIHEKVRNITDDEMGGGLEERPNE